MYRLSRRVVSILVAAFLIAVVAPATAAFATGASWVDAEPIASIPWSGSIEGTLTAVNHDDGLTDYEYWYSFTMTAGQTINVTATLPPVGDMDFRFRSHAFVYDWGLRSDPFDSTHRQLAIMAPRAAKYELEVFASAPGTFSIEATTIPPVTTTLSSFWVPKSAKKKRSFTVSVKAVPDYDSLFSPIRFYIERRSHGIWKKYGYSKGLLADGSWLYQRFAAKLKLPKGKFRVRARFTDAAHPNPLRTVWKQVEVK